MGSEDRSSGSSSPSIPRQRPPLKQEEWRCTDPFLNRVRKEGLEVKVYLNTGAQLVGYIDEYDAMGLVFYGAAKGESSKKQLIFRSSISTVVMNDEGEGSNGG